MIEIWQDNQLVENIKFPITKVGETSKIELLLKNPEKVNMDIFLKPTLDEDLRFVTYPHALGPLESAKCIIEFSPKLTRRTALKCELEFEVVIS